jgi:hypothetical protein
LKQHRHDNVLDTKNETVQSCHTTEVNLYPAINISQAEQENVTANDNGSVQRKLDQSHFASCNTLHQRSDIDVHVDERVARGLSPSQTVCHDTTTFGNDAVVTDDGPHTQDLRHDLSNYGGFIPASLEHALEQLQQKRLSDAGCRFFPSTVVDTLYATNSQQSLCSAVNTQSCLENQKVSNCNETVTQISTQTTTNFVRNSAEFTRLSSVQESDDNASNPACVNETEGKMLLLHLLSTSCARNNCITT